MAYTTPRILRLFTQMQTLYTAFNNTTGTWLNTNANLIRVDQGTLDTRRGAPYSRFPVVTGSRSELSGIRGRKNASVTIRGVPLIPNGTTLTVPDTDHLLQSVFGAAATSGVYSFSDTGYVPISLFAFYHGVTQTNRAVWGGTVTRVTFHFNGLYLTMDVDIAAANVLDSVGFSAFDTQGKAALTAFPTEPSSPTVNGTPLPGFGQGFTCTIHSQSLELKVRALSVTVETGNELVEGVYGSAYPIAIVGGARRVSIMLSAVDDNTAALNDLKTQCDTDLAATGITATIVAGTTAGNQFTWVLNNIQPNAFNMRDEGAMVITEVPVSYAHASGVGQTDDMTLTCN